MARKSTRRATAPTAGVVDVSSEVVQTLYELARKLILLSSGGKYTISVEGKRIKSLFQAVPKYSADLSLVPDNFTKEGLFFNIRGKDPVEITVRKIKKKIVDVRLTTKHSCITTEKLPPRGSIDPKVIKKSKVIDLVFTQTTDSPVPLVFNGIIE